MYNAKRLRSLMAERGLKPEDLARELQVNRMTVNGWVKGVRRPLIEHWPALERLIPGLFDEEVKVS